MSTRHAPPDGPLNQERYMSSPEYAELRGVSGTAIAARAAVLHSAQQRRLLYFLQALSLKEGGLPKVADDLLARFPERIGTPAMHRLGRGPGRIYTPEQAFEILTEEEPSIIRDKLLYDDSKPSREEDPWQIERDIERAEETLRRCFPLGPMHRRGRDLSPEEREAEYRELQQKLTTAERRKKNFRRDDPKLRTAAHFIELCEKRARRTLANHLLDLCVNPRQQLDGIAGFPWFRGMGEALLEFQTAYEEEVRQRFAVTSIGQRVFDTLDWMLRARRMAVIEGREGRGKSEAAKAWAEMHLGQVRYLDLTGAANKTSLFRQIGKCLGLGGIYSRKIGDLQVRIQDVLQRSGLALVIDEAHYLLPQFERVSSRPELIDWVDTALCNRGVPVALVTTPQFTYRMHEAERQTGWNASQFLRRACGRWTELPERSTDEDLQLVARRVWPGLDASGIKLAVGYAKLSGRDVSGLGDLALDARLVAEDAGRSDVIFADLDRAISAYRVPADAAMTTAFKLAEQKANERRGRRVQGNRKPPEAVSRAGGLQVSFNTAASPLPSRSARTPGLRLSGFASRPTGPEADQSDNLAKADRPELVPA